MNLSGKKTEKHRQTLVLRVFLFFYTRFTHFLRDCNDVINVNTKKGNVVILSEEDYNGLIETLYLTSIPGMKERLIEGKNAPLEDSDVFEW